MISILNLIIVHPNNIFTGFTMHSNVSVRACAVVSVDVITTCGVIHAWLRGALVDISLAPSPCITRLTQTHVPVGSVLARAPEYTWRGEAFVDI